MEAILALEDGAVFRGRAFGAVGRRLGEVVFNTSMTGYQEVLTDPSYAGQIVAMTSPHQGNYGTTVEDDESDRIQVNGFVIRDESPIHSNWRSRKDLHQYLKESGVVGISDVDTRRLTRHIRQAGAMKGCLVAGPADPETAVVAAREAPGLEQQDLVGRVSCRVPYAWAPERDRSLTAGSWLRCRGEGLHVVAYDFGVKRNILRCLRETGVRVTVVPAATAPDEVLALQPHGIFLSNGPGDPAAATYAIDNVRALIGQRPIFGICLGHQILALASGARTFKLKFGHRGANHPVQDLGNRQVAITSQNHGYAVDEESLPPGLEVTHRNLNDGTVEGLRDADGRFFSVQYHPESSPGPHDSLYLFDRFLDAMGRPEPAGAAEEPE